MALPPDFSRPDKPLFGEFARLWRLNLAHLQNDLATIKADLHQNDKPTRRQVNVLRRTLHDYSKSLPVALIPV
jgi:hypothetical protein